MLTLEFILSILSASKLQQLLNIPDTEEIDWNDDDDPNVIQVNSIISFAVAQVLSFVPAYIDAETFPDYLRTYAFQIFLYLMYNRITNAIIPAAVLSDYYAALAGLSRASVISVESTSYPDLDLSTFPI